MAKLYFYYSTMNAGKSTTLLQSSYNYRERNMNTMVYTAAIDDRFGAGKVTSRIGIHEEANLFTYIFFCLILKSAEHDQTVQIIIYTDVVQIQK